jgi:hypothetical protein
MLTVHVSPDDLRFPLDREIWEDPNIWYHGTRSAYSDKIEREGWQAGDLPYSISDVRKVVEIYDTIRVRGSSQDFEENFDSILCDYTLEGRNDEFEKSAISLTRDYWGARNYAMINGGETINALLRACKYLSNLVNDDAAHREHRQRLQLGIDDFNKRNDREIVRRVKPVQDTLNRMRECQRNFSNQQHLMNCEFELKKIKKKYERIIKNSYPVVYAVEFKTPEKVLEYEGTNPYDSKWSSWIKFEIVRESISPSKIICRIDFPAGISNYYEVVFGHWITNRLLPWRS